MLIKLPITTISPNRITVDIPADAYGEMTNNYATESVLYWYVEVDHTDETVQEIDLPYGPWDIATVMKTDEYKRVYLNRILSKTN